MPLTVDERLERIDDAIAVLNEIGVPDDGDSVEEHLDAIAAAWVARGILDPQIDLGSGSITGALPDGLTLTTTVNRSVAEPPPGDSVRRKISQALGAPSSKEAVITELDGGNFLDEARNLLTAGGYDVTTIDGSLDSFRTQVKDVGFLFADMHGMLASRLLRFTGSAAEWGETVYALQTGTRLTRDQVLANVAEFESGDLVLTAGESATGTFVANIGMTPSFLRKHWSFDDGVVLMHSCFGGSPAAPGGINVEPLRVAAFDAGAALWISFDNYTNSYYSGPTMARTLDLMMGLNQVAPTVEPPRRPFVWEEVRDRLEVEGLNPFDIPRRVNIPSAIWARTVTMTFAARDNDPEVALKPVITSAQATSNVNNGSVLLVGVFGEDPEVQIDGETLVCPVVERKNIACIVPNTGRASAGELVVRVGELESNPVTLTRWAAEISVNESGPGSLVAEATLEVELLAVTSPLRTALSAEPVTDAAQISALPVSGGEFNASGSASSGGATTTWSGQATLDDILITDTSENYFSVRGEVDPESLTMELNVLVNTAYTSTTTVDQGGTTILDPGFIVNELIELTLDPDSLDAVAGAVDASLGTVSWDRMEADGVPPDDVQR